MLATTYEILALEPTSGKRLWSLADYPADFDDEGADWENDARFRTHALHVPL